MRQITDGEKKLVDIMETYGSVDVGVDNGSHDYCSFEGDMSTTANTWMHIGYGCDANDGIGEITPIEETYLALNSVMWKAVKYLTRK